MKITMRAIAFETRDDSFIEICFTVQMVFTAVGIREPTMAYRAAIEFVSEVT
jgi:hypothetical protein